MKRVFARIGMYLEITDEENAQLLKEAGVNPNNGESNEFDINSDFAKRFIKDGTLAENDSYIPFGCIPEV